MFNQYYKSSKRAKAIQSTTNLVDLDFSNVEDETFLKEFKSSKLLPALIDEIGKLPGKSFEGDPVKVMQFLKTTLVKGQDYGFGKILIDNKQIVGAIKLFATCYRNKYLHLRKQTDDLSYCNAVPLFYSAFKKRQGIPYSAWNIDNPTGRLLLGKDLAECWEHREDYDSVIAALQNMSVDQRESFKDESLRRAAGEHKPGKIPETKEVYKILGLDWDKRSTGEGDFIGKFNILPNQMKAQSLGVWIYGYKPSPMMLIRYDDVDNISLEVKWDLQSRVPTSQLDSLLEELDRLQTPVL